MAGAKNNGVLSIADIVFSSGALVLLATLVLLPLAVFPPAYDLFILPKAVLLRLGVFLSSALALASLALGRRPERIEAKGALISLFLLLITSTLLSENLILSVFGNFLRGEGAMTFLAYFSLVPLSMFFFSEKQGRRSLFKGMSLSISLVALLGVLEQGGLFRIRSGEQVELARIASTSGNPDFLGILLAMFLPMFGYLAVRSKGFLGYSSALAALLSLAALLMTESRAALAAMALTLPFALLAAIFKDWKASRQIGVSLALTLLLAGGAIAVGPQRFSLKGIVSGFEERRLNMEATLHLVAARPLSGYGIDTYVLNSSRVKPVVSSGSQSIFDRPHDGLLYLTYALGFPGLAAFLWLIFASLARGWKRWRQRGKGAEAALLASALAYLVGELSLFSTPTTTPYFFVFLGLLLGGAGASSSTEEEGERTQLLYAGGALAVTVLLLASTVLSSRQLAADISFKQGIQDRSGEVERVRSYFESTLALNPWNAEYYDAVTRVFIDSNEPSLVALAPGVVSKGLEYFPQDHRLLIVSGNTNLVTGLTAQAVADFRKAAELAPADSIAHWALATALEAQGDLKGARDSLKKALELNPGLQGARDMLEDLEKETGFDEKAAPSREN